MAIYIRAYPEFCYEIIFTGGKVKKKRFHILINPNRHVKLPVKNDEEIRINTESLTHIASMEPSLSDPDMIQRTIKIAEITNRPIITNKDSKEKFREYGISITQLRTLGYEEQIVDGLNVDPVYKEEISDDYIEEYQKEKPSIINVGKQVIDLFNPLKWQKEKTSKRNIQVDPTKPLALVISMKKNNTILIPLDRRGIDHINMLVGSLKPWLTVILSNNIGKTFDIEEGTKNILFIQDNYEGNQTLQASKGYNLSVPHNTFICGIKQWAEVPEQ
jgi:hypothetical protein